ncbi:serine hydrolase [Bosea sp. CS1GBMeth4]|uniref:serine hydrolase n=1 Tax=Bosea sp. CS1GBMeth4 TaxID=1892849 RepID=UPI001647A493|nr:serine hydrolase [Bosea sp. CS1GBMeth4]
MSFFTDDAELQRIGALIEGHARPIYAARGVPFEQFAYVLLQPGRDGAGPRGASLRANWRAYPCSLVKVFHLVAAQLGLEEGRLTAHGELDRAMRDMILWSSNSATNYIIDLLTGTTGDTLLGDAEMAAWRERREGINRIFAGLGWPELAGINLNQKLMDDLRYGREKIALDLSPGGHNCLTPTAMARLMHEIFSESTLLPPARRAITRDHLARHADSPDRGRGAYQLLGYLGEALPKGTQIWSKAGRTRWLGDDRASFRRHDTLRAILPQGQEFLLTVFTQGEAIAEDDGFLPAIGSLVAAELSQP